MTGANWLDKSRRFRFDFEFFLVWMLLTLSMVVAFRSSNIDEDYYYAFPRNRLIEQMASYPYSNVVYSRPFPKRSTLIWNPLVIALQKALKPESERDRAADSGGAIANYMPTKNMDQLSGPNGKVYWKCYFNAVSCFTKK
ncbi:hypothetical protein CHUAL_007032 [Chamberlinius hualienensis]